MSNFAENLNAMKTKQELLNHCRYYHVEDDSPPKFNESDPMAFFFWKAEYTWVSSSSMLLDTLIKEMEFYGFSDEQMKHNVRTRRFTSIPIGFRACLFAVLGCGTDCSCEEVAKFFPRYLDEYINQAGSTVM